MQVLPAFEAHAGEREIRLRLVERGARLADLLVELRRLDFGEHVARLHRGADVGDDAFHVAIHARVERRLLRCLDAAREDELGRGFARRGDRDGVAGDEAGGRFLERVEVRAARQDPGHEQGGEQRAEAEQERRREPAAALNPLQFAGRRSEVFRWSFSWVD